MTKKDFLRRVAEDKSDFLQAFLSVLNDGKIPFCLIGGLAVNAYAEPVVSLDLDIVVEASRLDEAVQVLKRTFRVKRFPNSINISAPGSDLRIQIQGDLRYQDFLPRARVKDVLGYRLPVARIEDVLLGKIWAAGDAARRPSKRHKDMADILRLLEAKKSLAAMIPADLKRKLPL
ncbi:MAG TPA: hypothetical protein VMS75_00185 [Terriglobales bacterium]|nr:hypothetical protein [Terriglobales bacterium]